MVELNRDDWERLQETAEKVLKQSLIEKKVWTIVDKTIKKELAKLPPIPTIDKLPPGV